MSPEKISQISKLREQYKTDTGRDLVEDTNLVSEAVRKLTDPEDIVQFSEEYLAHLKRSSSDVVRNAAGYYTTSHISLAVSSLKRVVPDQSELWQKTFNVPDFTKGLKPPKRPGPLR